MEKQVEFLSQGLFKDGTFPSFEEKLKTVDRFPLRPNQLETLQINMGYMCNQTCAHCHVDAGPHRREIMTKDTMLECLRVIENLSIRTVDMTGGAPEMNPNFRWFVEKVSKHDIKDLIVRSNLTIIKANKSYADLPDFFAKHKVHVISSMPHWTSGKTDRQRGKGVFKKSIEALKMLNSAGYGMPDSSLKLDLVYNPSGAFLPGNQSSLEKDFKKALMDEHGIYFHQLYALANLPVNRFLDYLLQSGNFENYMETLISNFNPLAVENVMCKNTMSIGWNGDLYDCDFNQMLKLPVQTEIKHISRYNQSVLEARDIAISQHCYGCVAGSGSSCKGSVV